MIELEILSPFSQVLFPGSASPEVIDLIKRVTSFQKGGYQFTEAYQSGRWDGFTRLGRLDGPDAYIFPTGLVPHVMAALERVKLDVLVTDLRTLPDPMWEPSRDMDDIELRDYQQAMIDSVSEASTAQNVNEWRLDDERSAFLSAKIGQVTPYRLPGVGIWWSATGSGKTEAAAGLISRLAVPTVFMVYGNTLVQQTADRFRRRLGSWLDKNNINLTVCKEGEFVPGDIVIAGTTTLATILRDRKHDQYQMVRTFLKDVDLLIFDEAHGVAADTAYRTVMECRAYYRVAMSGTPLDRSDYANLKVIAGFGDVVHRVTNKEMVAAGWVPQATIKMVHIAGKSEGNSKNWQQVYQNGVVEYEPRNLRIVSMVQDYYDQGKKILVLFKQLEHGERLSHMLWCEPGADDQATFIPHARLDGRSPQEERDETLDQFKAGRFNVLMASDIFQQGVDLPSVDVVINAAGGKAVIPVLQRLGRGLRGTELEMIDFADSQHRILARHSLARLRVYREQECFNIVPM